MGFNSGFKGLMHKV